MRTKFYIRLLLLLFLVTVCTFCKKESSSTLQSTYSSKLDEIFATAGNNPNLRCLIVYKDGEIVKEKYFQSTGSSTPHDVRSVTKSVMATLIGIAIDKGYIKSEDTTIGSYLKPYVGTIDTAKAKIRIHNILTMSCGMFSDELTDASKYLTWLNAPNQVAYTLNQPLISTPGETFYYSSGVAHLTSAILTQASGMSTYQFAKQFLFIPLSINDRSWLTDKQGIYNGGAGLELTPYDMLAFGKLYLNKGTYNGSRIVSEAWIIKATSSKIATNNAQPFGPSYGYFWWIGSSTPNYYFANGYGGQFIVIVPDENLIVVATNSWANIPEAIADQQWYNTIDIIINRIIPLYE